MRSQTILVAMALLACGTSAWGQAGSPDPTFGTGGIVLTDATSGSDGARDGVMLADGRFVTCGPGNSSATFLLARYLPDGDLDPNFGTAGIATTSFAGTTPGANGIALQSDGKLVVAGAFRSGGSEFSAIARYDTSGALDPTFGTGGKVSQLIGPIGEVTDVLVQPDGKILILGSFRVTGTTTFLGMRRYRSTGVLDSTFGINGTVTRGPGTDNHGYAMTLQEDGRIVAVGTTDLSDGAGANFLTFRFKPNGTPDSTFGTVGRAITSVSVFHDFAKAVAVLDDDRIVVAGNTGVPANTSHKYAVARFLANGTLDTDFDTDGIALTPEMGLTSGYAFLTDMHILGSGKILLCGQATNSGSSDDFAVARMTDTGAMDGTFDGDGVVYNDLSGGGRDIPYRMLREASGKLVVVGQAGGSVFPGGTQIAAIRYLMDEGPTTGASPMPRPIGVQLSASWPNPFVAWTRVAFRLPESADVTIRVYDLAGREVSTVAAGWRDAGEHVVAWDGRDAGGARLGAGVYLCRLTARTRAGRVESAGARKMMLVR